MSDKKEKGLIDRIVEAGDKVSDGHFDAESFRKMLDEMCEKAHKQAIERDKSYKETLKLISDREKIHGPAPEMLYLKLMLARNNGVLHLTSDEGRKYAKWLTDEEK